MRYRTLRVALLLLGSGFCGLVYQVAWFRLFRLVFGASTAASGAVLGIFMAGLGFGGLLLGKRADRSPSPLRMYAHLEAGVALGAAATPLLIPLIQWVYVSLGGSTALGLAGSSVVRLLLSLLVLAVPTFLMGGTLPAATRAVERAADRGRRSMGVLYATNTVGAVLGALFANFISLEVLGTNRTLWCAALFNLLIVVIARSQARKMKRSDEDAERAKPDSPSEASAPEEEAGPSESPPSPAATRSEQLPAKFVLVAAAVVGFAFFLMELVWYRMLAPVLGGSSYTFGLILAIALAGVGLGGYVYAVGGKTRRPTVLTFAVTCAFEAVFMVLPFAWGDGLAALAIVLRPMGDIGFPWLVSSWTMVTALVVFFPALVAGYQFPLLVALMGSGRREVGRQVGQVYAWNTVGAIVGSFAGGFGLLPLLSAPGSWRAVVGVMLVLTLATLVLALRGGASWRRALLPLAAALAAAVLVSSPGPSAAWRHSPIGAGRVRATRWTEATLQDELNHRRRTVLWEADGVESSVAIDGSDGISVFVNGKSDSNVISDGPTTVMSGLVPSLLHGSPATALVIGLGTGGTAGWLAEVPSMERVDTIELEEAVVHVATECNPATHGAVGHERVNLVIADAREYILTSRGTYDLVISEPSNPYRAGVASLFTQEFYESVSDRLGEDGIFAQWVQAYEVDPGTVRTAYSTLASVFPHVESWEVSIDADVLLLASNRPITHDVRRTGELVTLEPYRSALEVTWGVEGTEGLYSGFLAGDGLARVIHRAEPESINTDDRTLIEFQFARSVGTATRMAVGDIRDLALDLGFQRPTLAGGALDWQLVEEMRAARCQYVRRSSPIADASDEGAGARIRARQAYSRGEHDEARRSWASQPGPATSPADRLMLADLSATAGSAATAELVEALRPRHPVEAEVVLATYFDALGDAPQATAHLVRAFASYRDNPWAWRRMTDRAISLALRIGHSTPGSVPLLFDALGEPFAVRLHREARMAARVTLANDGDFESLCLPALADLEPHPPWTASILSARVRCYEGRGHSLAPRARADLELFRRQQAAPFAAGLAPVGSRSRARGGPAD